MLVKTLALAKTAPDAGAAGALKRACEDCNAALIDGTYVNRKKRAKLCKDHGIQCTQEIWSNPEAGVRAARSELAQRLHIRYVTMKPCTATIPTAPEDDAVPLPKAMDIATAFTILRHNKADHETVSEFRVMFYWLEN